MKTVGGGEGGGTAPAPARRQTVCRLLPKRCAAWRRLEAMLEDRRRLYNTALEERVGCYRNTGKTRTYFDRCRALTECRRDIPGMAACPVAVQRGTLKRLDEAFRAFFRRVRKGGAPGFPRFRGRRFFSSVSIVSGVKVRDGTLRIPSFGALRIQRRGGNPYPGLESSSDLARCRIFFGSGFRFHTAFPQFLPQVPPRGHVEAVRPQGRGRPQAVRCRAFGHAPARGPLRLSGGRVPLSVVRPNAQPHGSITTAECSIACSRLRCFLETPLWSLRGDGLSSTAGYALNRRSSVPFPAGQRYG